MSYIINNVDNSVQEIDGINATDDLVVYGYDLTQYAIATDDQVTTYLLKQAINEALQENDEALNSKPYITTSQGHLGLVTPVDSLATVFEGLVTAQLPTYHQVLRTYEGVYLPDLTSTQFQSLFGEVLYAYERIDQIYVSLKDQISACTTIDQVNAITIDYSSI